MSEVKELEAESKICKDPECDGISEPEIDGDHRYWVCDVCGFEFDYEFVSDLKADDSCQVGISEDVRRVFQGQPGAAAHPEKLGPPIISIGRKPE